ncbi:MAG TPA: tetratricopeptide repeat protein [Candidatus Angelobacter sp.]|nr:tetratricopeptide repeat protein [Candidatus Angelobacter sp.]
MAAFAADPTPASLVRDGHFKQARPLVEQEIRTNPKNAAALVLMARIDLAYDDHEQAIKLLLQAIELDSGNSDAHVYLAEAYGRKIEHAGVFDKVGMAKTIRKESERAVAADPRNLDALESLMEFHLEAPAMVGGDKDKAHDLAQRIAELDAVRGEFAKASVAAREKRYDDEKQLQISAVQSNPRSYDALVSAARLYLRDLWLDYRVAAEYATRGIAVNPTRVRAYSALAQCYAAEGKLEPLKEVLLRAETRVPDDLSPYFYAGETLLARKKDPAVAEKYLRRYLTQEPEGEGPSLGEAHWRLGQALAQQGKKDEAVHELGEAVRIKPDLKDARKDLKRLKSSTESS